MNTKKEVFNRLTNSIDDWKIDSYWATHKSGLQYWIANGFMFFGNEAHNISVHMGFWYKLKLYRWIREAQRKQLLKD